MGFALAAALGCAGTKEKPTDIADAAAGAGGVITFPIGGRDGSVITGVGGSGCPGSPIRPPRL